MSGAIDRARLPSPVLRVLSLLESAGYPAYLVGGCVRDLLRGREPHDFDVTSAALPAETMRVFDGFPRVETGAKHGTVGVLVDGMWCEITTFRTDGDYLDGRHPARVDFTRTVEEDLARRDFTINAMAYRPREGALIDLFGGERDLEAGLLRCVGEPRQRFEEDALRILRAFRFAAQLDFEIEKETLAMAGACASRLAPLSPERIGAEWIKLITAPDPAPAIDAMARVGVLPYVMPDAEKGRAPEGAARLCRLPDAAALRLACLLFDRPPHRVAAMLSAWRQPGARIRQVCALLAALDALPLNEAIAARRFRQHYGALCEEAITLYSALGEGREAEAARSRALCETTRTDPVTLAALALDGRDLQALGLRGAAIGSALNALLEEVICDPSKNDRETLLTLARAHNDSQNAKQ